MNSSRKPLSDDGGSASKRFELTQWSLILRARDEGAPGSAEALEQFIKMYWRPLYAFIRRQGYPRPDAQDLTQDFCCYFREKRLLERIVEPQGRFRSFLLVCLKNFLSDQRDRNGALKRGGGVGFLSLEALAGEESEIAGPNASLTPEQQFDLRWAQTVMERALALLREECLKAGRAELFDLVKDLEVGERTGEGYQALSARLGMTESALKSAVLRLRRRHGTLLRTEIGRTVGRTEDIDEEISHLIAALGT